jgi:hypothetical protein
VNNNLVAVLENFHSWFTPASVAMFAMLWVAIAYNKSVNLDVLFVRCAIFAHTSYLNRYGQICIKGLYVAFGKYQSILYPTHQYLVKYIVLEYQKHTKINSHGIIKQSYIHITP